LSPSGGGGFKLLARTAERLSRDAGGDRAQCVRDIEEVRECLLGGSGNHGLPFNHPRLWRQTKGSRSVI
jgi:hypothetical protein